MKNPQVGHDFRSLHFLFIGMLFPCNMQSDARWLDRSRLWRLILTGAPPPALQQRCL